MRQVLLKALGTIGYIIHYGCVAHCTFEYVGDFVMCSGPSMEPTIFSDNILLTEHITPVTQTIARGDIVIAKCPSNPKQYICKRVTALAGDKVRTGFCNQIIPIGHVWLEGDNRGNSSDSRSYGPVPLGLIRSRALCKVWPIKDITVLTR